jgi:hypothetical protein
MSSVKKGASPRGAATKNQVGNQGAGADAIDIKATIPDHQIDAALHGYNLTVDDDEER